MFKVGEYIVYGCKGVCLIEEITHIDIPGSNKDRLYYVLAPYGDGKGKIYAPTDNEKVTMRKVITKSEAEQLIKEMPSIEELWVTDEKKRELKYKEALKTCRLPSLDQHHQNTILPKTAENCTGKKITSLDERYLKATENELYSELSLTLGIPKNEMERYINERLEVV